MEKCNPYITSIHFKPFSATDITNISVQQVTNDNALNKLGHANPGGLYDNKFG